MHRTRSKVLIGLLGFSLISGLFLVFTSQSSTTWTKIQDATELGETQPGRMLMMSLPVAAATAPVETEVVPNTIPVPATAEETPAEIRNNTSVPTPTPKPAPTVKKTASKPVTTKTAQQQSATPAPTTCSGAFTEKFLCLLNQYRASKSKGKLSGSSTLSTVALGHSTWMNSTGTFSHTGINGSRLADRCRTASTTCRGENLAKNASSPEHLLEMWKASPSHNSILLGSYTVMGMGINGIYTTALFN